MSGPISRDKSDSRGPPARTPSVGDSITQRKSVSRPQSGSTQRRRSSGGSRTSAGGTETGEDHVFEQQSPVHDPDKEYDTDLEIEENEKTFDRSWEEIYTEACKRYNVVPASYFLRNMRKETLIMRHHGLGPKGAQAIAVALVTNTMITKLDISDNHIEDMGFLAIAEMLKENFYILDLALADNPIGELGVTAMGEILKTNPSLVSVSLSGCELDDSMATILGDAIEKMQKVENLDLSHNKLGDKSADAIAKGISESMSLKSLDISWNNFRSKGIATIAKGIKQAYSMTKVNLSWNGVENEGALQLADAIKSTDILKELDLTNTRLNTEAAVNLAKGLATNETLLVLKVGKNPMESAGCFGIITPLIANANSKIQKIHFDDILVNQDFDEQFAKVREVHPDLEVVTGGHEGERKKRVPKNLQHPLLKIKNFIDEKEIKLIDFFQQVDKNNSMTINKEEFRNGLTEMGIVLTDEEIATVIAVLDRDMSGTINYGDFADFVDTLEPDSSHDLVKTRIMHFIRLQDKRAQERAEAQENETDP